MGTASTADRLILSGESVPFIMVFPDDHYWNLPAGATFGVRLINEILPYVDKNYRTHVSREYRALGGLSRGGGWALQLGLDHPDLFGSLGLHSPAIFQDHGPFVESLIQNIPEEARPRLWLDIGDNDKELGKGRQLEEIFTRTNYLHEFHVFNGDHSELYWSAHVETYLRWYSKVWSEASSE
jgi:enterochelin esterase-like enzyme